MSSFFYTNPAFAVVCSLAMAGAMYEMIKTEVPPAVHPPKLVSNTPLHLPLQPPATPRRPRSISISTESALAGVSSEELL
jgi:hypothetical protein